MKLRLLTDEDMRHAADSAQAKAWCDAQRPTAETPDISFPCWRDDLRREVEKRRLVSDAFVRTN